LNGLAGLLENQLVARNDVRLRLAAPARVDP
jgi:hypothetical protein